MHKSIPLLFLAATLLSSCSKESQKPSPMTEISSSLVYADQGGHFWKRALVTEKISSSVLFLVTDVPLNAGENAVVQHRNVFRKYFKVGEELEFEKAWETYSSPYSASAPLNMAVVTNNPLWPLKRTFWTQQDEMDYNNWVQAYGSPSFFQNTGFHVDCADYAMGLRWIFAHDHGLPAGNTLAGSGMLFGSWMGSTDWDQLPTDVDWKKDQRLKAALTYLFQNSFTHSFVDDLYPVEINTQYVTAGAIDLNLTTDTGNTQVIKNIGIDPRLCADAPCIAVLAGDVPASEHVHYMRADIRQQTRAGFMRHRPPQKVNGRWRLTPAKDLPGYSLEQYSWAKMEYSDFYDLIFERLGMDKLSDVDQVIMDAESISDLLIERVGVVNSGYFLCSLHKCAVTDPDFFSYSTPNRDQDIRDKKKNLMSRLKKINQNDPKFLDYKMNILDENPLPGLNKTMANYIFDEPSVTDLFDSDPRSDLALRWGEFHLSPDERGPLEYYAWVTNWWNRWDLVDQHLSSKNLDDGFRIGLPYLLKIVSQANAKTRTEMINKAQNNVIDVRMCPWHPYDQCQFADLIFRNPPLVNTMTSEASDPLPRRFGF